MVIYQLLTTAHGLNAQLKLPERVSIIRSDLVYLVSAAYSKPLPLITKLVEKCYT